MKPLTNMASAVILALAMLSGTAAMATATLPAPIRADGFELAPVGGDELKLFGFRVYQATLWSPDGRYRPDRPSAFSLHYRREFSREDLVDITVKAWRKMGIGTEDKRRAWADHLLRVWQDVSRDDILTAVVIPGGETRFYSAAGVLGRIEDKEFGPAFLGIWLDERTLLPELRTSLLGLKRDS
jgi:Chalcone isomerase-like